MVGSLLCCLNLTGQLLLSKIAAEVSKAQIQLEIWLDCDVVAGGTPSLQVPAGKKDKISDFFLVCATRPRFQS